MTEQKHDNSKDKKSGVSRREFITGAVAGAVAGGVLLAPKEVTANTVQAVSPYSLPGAMYPIKYGTDVVVIGAGGGGECAAVSAAQQGVRVILLEVSQKTGGGQAYSGGDLHCCGLKTWSDYLAYTEGLHDPVLGQTYVTTFRNVFLPWLTSIGAYYTPGTGVGPLWTGDPTLGHGEPGYEGHRLYFNSLEKAFANFGGGPILLKTRGLKLLTDEYGDIAGVRACTWLNSPTEQNPYTFDIAARAVILACGNFINNPELKMKYIGPYADKAFNMGVPYARGDGMLMAQELGASLSGSMSTFSGIPVALTPMNLSVQTDPNMFEQASAASNPNGLDYGTMVSAGMYFAPGWIALTGPLLGPSYGVLVNLQGKRFVDENSPEDSKYPRLTESIISQRQGMAFMVADKVIHDLAAGSDYLLSLITGAGGFAAQENTLAALAGDMAAAFPFYSGNFLATIQNYNAAIAAGTTTQLDPPRTVLPTAEDAKGGLYPIATPPFYACAVTVAMYYNMGGLAINTSAEVLDIEKKPIPGLYATFPCAGGLMNTIYTGGNASSSVFGYIAGQNAANFVKTGLT